MPRVIAELARIFGPAKPLLSGVGDRQPVQQTPLKPQRKDPYLPLEAQCNQLRYCSTYCNNLHLETLGSGSIHKLPRRRVFSATHITVLRILIQ